MPVIEATLADMREWHDWREAFKYAAAPEPVPGYKPSKLAFDGPEMRVVDA